jgi:2'-5' RNA ligase
VPKYNLALIPMTKADKVIELSRKFLTIADKYLLGKKSLPHVTLYQFEAEKEDIKAVWKHVCDVWEKKSIALEFKEFSCITFDENIYWISLLPDNRDTLYKMHNIIANIIKQPGRKKIDPHMTLINTKNTTYKKKVDELSGLYTPIIDIFTLALGKSDDVGQFTKVIYFFDIKPNNIL